jgi:2',3'-cyclic-nucleotide 2'-phosphodiesterase (5'-nucleotidase family)
MMHTVIILLLVHSSIVNSFTLNIYHTNDIHARYDERGPSEGGKCNKPEKGKLSRRSSCKP